MLQVIIAGRFGTDDTKVLLAAAHGPFCPDKAVVLVDPTDPSSLAFWRQHNPEAAAMVDQHFAALPPATPGEPVPEPAREQALALV